MNGEIIAIVGVGAALAGLILASIRGLRQDMNQLRQDMNRLEERLRDGIKQLDARVARLEHSQAKLEGLLEGLREAITGRAAAH